MEALLTQLVYEHACRVRLVGGGAADKDGAADGAGETKDTSKHLIGKLNNLLTSDLSTMSRVYTSLTGCSSPSASNHRFLL